MMFVLSSVSTTNDGIIFPIQFADNDIEPINAASAIN